MAEVNIEAGIANTPRVNEADNPDLYAKVAEGLKALTGDADEAELVEADAEVVAEEESTDTAVIDSDEEADASAAAADDDEGAADDSPTLPEAIRRSLKAYEWSDEEIDEAFTRDPDGFLGVANKLHTSRVRQTQEWAALGRASRDEESVPEPAPTAPPSEEAFPDNGLTQIDFKRLAEESGFDEDVLKKAFGPVATTIDAINQILPALNDGVAASKANEQDRLAREIDKFFQADDMTAYTEFYGQSWDDVDEKQVDHRNKVIELADNMIVGAAQHGRRLATVEALELAHHSVASEFKESAVRSTLKKSVTQRNKGLTLKPTSKTASAAAGGEKDRSALIRDTRDRLAKVFGN